MTTDDVWVTYEPTNECMCWMDVVCLHGWTWQEDSACSHRDGIMEDVHKSFADAVRNLFQIRGANAVGRLLRERFHNDPRTMTVYVMPPSSQPLRCDHDAYGGVPPTWIIERKTVQARSRPGDEFRTFQDHYRGR
mgnify:CR=1 FL=1